MPKQKTTKDNSKQQCPYCGKTFYQGLYHPATQKLHQHVSDRHRFGVNNAKKHKSNSWHGTRAA
eukprot:scaffold18588_cov79-Cyclotella_meneghiniana.AAC.3